MQILSSNGRTLILNEGSEACSTAKKFFESCLREQVHISDNRSNAVEIKSDSPSNAKENANFRFKF